MPRFQDNNKQNNYSENGLRQQRYGPIAVKPVGPVVDNCVMLTAVSILQIPITLYGKSAIIDSNSSLPLVRSRIASPDILRGNINRSGGERIIR